MEEPRIVELPAYRVVKIRYEGPRPPAPEFFAHWRLTNRWAADHGIVGAIHDIVMIGYEPPGVAGGGRFFVYDACIPVGEGMTLPDGRAELAWTPGGRFVMCSGELRELLYLYREARRYAAAHGLAIERGGIELYRSHPLDPRGYLVDAGCRIHD